MRTLKVSEHSEISLIFDIAKINTSTKIMYGRHLDPLTDSRPATVEQTHKITITKKKIKKKSELACVLYN